MNRRVVSLLLPLMLAAGAAFAQTGPSHEPIGLGFRSMDAPIGMRWWLTSGTVAVDVGLGFGSEENTAVDESLSHWAFEVGLPIVLKSWDPVHFLVRPGIMYSSQEAVVQTVPTVDTDTDSELSIMAEFEAEVFLAKN